MFVLADMLQLPELRQEALDQFMRSLQVDNVCIELSSSFLGKYDRVRHLTFEFIKSNWKAVTQTLSFAQLMEEGLSHVSPAVRADFQKLFKCLDVVPGNGIGNGVKTPSSNQAVNPAIGNTLLNNGPPNNAVISAVPAGPPGPPLIFPPGGAHHVRVLHHPHHLSHPNQHHHNHLHPSLN